ncbi:MAG: putative LPS assembly protein LptD [Saprospiraceae bacterium]|nr:putative LPS assembly protein LptD [Saprospiraceae bacterium]
MIRLSFIFILTVLLNIWGTAQIPDSISLDSIQPQDTVPRVRISKDSLSSRVDYGARDSMVFDNEKKLIHLYGEAYVNYQSLKLKANYIVVNIDSNLAIAEAGRDTNNNIIGVPEFIDGEQKFNAMKMRYNFKNKKGIVYEALTQEGDIYVRGARTKYISEGDATTGEDHIFNRNAIFTTCNLPEPHYGIRSGKQKVIPNRLVVTGPSVVEIHGVPTPLVMPFAFFPLLKGKRSGLIFPRDYEYSDRWGFGLRELGYYFPISDYVDLRVLGDIYFSGTWGITARSTYTQRYKYRGSLEIAYSDRVQEFPENYRKQHQRSFKIVWNHRQDKKANPFYTFSSNVNFQLNRFDQLNRNDANSALNNTLKSSIKFTRYFPDKPFTFTSSLRHTQNQNTGEINVAFPNLLFNVRQINPFQRKEAIGDPKWYENIGMSYSLEAENNYNTQDSLFLKDINASNLDYGVKHSLNISSNYTILKYLQFRTSVRFNEFWHFRQRTKRLDPTLILDTLSTDTAANGAVVAEVDSIFGRVLTDTIQKFTPFHDLSLSAGFSTKLFGTLRFKGWLRGIRHVITPSVSFNYSPNYRNENWNYWKTVSTSTRPSEDEMEEYSIFLPNIIGSPNVGEQQLSINYSFDNNFQAKIFSKSDSTEKNIKLLDNVSVSGNYNYAREELKWSMINISTYTKLFGGLTDVRVGARLDPYAVEYDENGNAERINSFAFDETGDLLRFDRADLNLTTRFTIGQLGKIVNGLLGKGGGEPVGDTPPLPTTPVDPVSLGPGEIQAPPAAKEAQGESLFDLFSNFSISHSIRFALTTNVNGDTVQINNHYMELSGALRLTPNWSVGFTRVGYNFKQEAITYPDLSFTRDLHCWQLTFSWQPVYGTYSLFIGVKPGSLDFLKVPYRRNNVDTFFN